MRTDSTSSLTSETEGYYTSSGSRDSTDSVEEREPSISNLTNSLFLSRLPNQSPNGTRKINDGSPNQARKISQARPTHIQSLIQTIPKLSFAKLGKEPEEENQLIIPRPFTTITQLVTKKTHLTQTQPISSAQPILSEEEKEIARNVVYGIGLQPISKGSTSDRFKRISSAHNNKRIISSAKDIFPDSRSRTPDNSSLFSHSPPREENPLPQKVRRVSGSDARKDTRKDTARKSASFVNLNIFKWFSPRNDSPRTDSARELSSSNRGSPTPSPKKIQTFISTGLSIEELSPSSLHLEQLNEARRQSLRTLVMDGKFICKSVYLNCSSKPITLSSDKKGQEATIEILGKFLTLICDAGWQRKENVNQDLKKEAEKMVNCEDSEFWPLLYRFHASTLRNVRDSNRKLFAPLFCEADIARDICKIERHSEKGMRYDLFIKGPLDFNLQIKMPLTLKSRPNYKSLAVSYEKAEKANPNNDRYHIADFEATLTTSASTEGYLKLSDFKETDQINELSDSTKKFIVRTLKNAGFELKKS